MRSRNLRRTSEIGAALIDYALLVGCSAFLVIASSAITSKAEQKLVCVAYNLGGGTDQLAPDWPDSGQNPCHVPETEE